jgi:uncharacterized protein (AIM24 family)
VNTSIHAKAGNVEYYIHGTDIQYVETVLKPGQAMICEVGTMMFFEQGIQMGTRINDGSQKNSGVYGTMKGIFKRKLTGENIFLSTYTNKSNEPRRVAFSTPHAGQVIPIELSNVGGSIHCHKSAFLCGEKGIEIGLGFSKTLSAGLFSGEGFLMQKLTGKGVVFIHAGGSIREYQLGTDEKLYVDTGSVVGFQSSCGFDVEMIKGMANMFFAEEDYFLTTVTGPGRVWIQSMPFQRYITSFLRIMNEKTKN